MLIGVWRSLWRIEATIGGASRRSTTARTWETISSAVGTVPSARAEKRSRLTAKY